MVRVPLAGWPLTATMSPINEESPKFFGAPAKVAFGSAANFEKSAESSKYLTKFCMSICRTSDAVPCACPGWGHMIAQMVTARAVRLNILDFPILHLAFIGFLQRNSK